MHPDETPTALAVVCHAHPLHGGMMHFKVVFRAAKAMQTRGLAALRFNFRGVGRSEGTHDHGHGEQDDVRAALGEAVRRFPGLPILLGGFSFGSSMALQVGVRDPRVVGLFALGLPLDMLGDLSFLNDCRKPRLFVQGSDDRFGAGQRVLDLTAQLPEPRSTVVIPESDHFFPGRLDALHEALDSWLAGRPWASP
jgi:alpha/beta superfamily hydrolase